MKIVTIKDVARAAKVSISTVSRVLNDRQAVDPDTRANVLDVVKKMNFVRNQSASKLKMQGVSAIGVILRGRRNAFLTDLAESVLEAGHGTGFQFILEIIDFKASQVPAARQLYLEHKLQGIIFLGANVDERDREDEMRALDLLQVYATVDASHLGNPCISSVSIDNRKAGRTAVEKLLELGHTKIALLGYFSKGLDSTGLRLYGALDALEAAGIEYDPTLYVETGFSLPEGYNSARALLEAGKQFTAVFAAGDIMAIGAIKAIREAGLRVPEDVSIIGFDGIELGQYLYSPLTTLRQPSEIIAKESVRLMRDLIQGKPASHKSVDFEFIPGGSIASVKH